MSKKPTSRPLRAAPSAADPALELERFAIECRPSLHVVGNFDTGITVMRQQIRALNLAWSMIESGRIPSKPAEPKSIAIVGAGFAGLTFAAALLAKKINCKITLFEEHDTLLPLQQGSDTRWLHPHIYDWPEDGSDSDVAMLPLLNWTAARASDVAVQILQDWDRIVSLGGSISLYCNTRHLQVSESQSDPRRARIEWIGDKRNSADGTSEPGAGAALGCAECFDEVVLAVGFGIEDGQPSYWRNETMGQPNLHQRRRTHLVSGQGDGALIDLFRLRISQYRQDRILEEMFAASPRLVGRLQEAKEIAEDSTGAPQLFECLDALFGEEAVKSDREARDVLEGLSRRLRRDTEAVLHLKVHEIAQLLEPATSRTSFQNALLAYLLYRVGGFAPSSETEEILRKRYTIPGNLVVRRHGTKRLNQLERMLSGPLFDVIKPKVEAKNGFATQRAEPLWPGGYFGYPGPSSEVADLDVDRSAWRKEYLPGATELVASTICGAVVGLLRNLRPNMKHVRVTLHRVLPLGNDMLLQQACNYQGIGFKSEPTAGRTFPTRSAMIGLAWRCRTGARTIKGASDDDIAAAMEKLDLHAAARNMMPSVSYVLALPVLQPSRTFAPPGPVGAVLYLDSKDDDFALEDHEIAQLSALVGGSFQPLCDPKFRGVRNARYRDACPRPGPRENLPKDIANAIELVDRALTPVSDRAFVLNFDRADPASIDPALLRSPKATKAGKQ